jgi:hypothetical protein
VTLSKLDDIWGTAGRSRAGRRWAERQGDDYRSWVLMAARRRLKILNRVRDRPEACAA